MDKLIHKKNKPLSYKRTYSTTNALDLPPQNPSPTLFRILKKETPLVIQKSKGIAAFSQGLDSYKIIIDSLSEALLHTQKLNYQFTSDYLFF